MRAVDAYIDGDTEAGTIMAGREIGRDFFRGAEVVYNRFSGYEGKGRLAEAKDRRSVRDAASKKGETLTDEQQRKMAAEKDYKSKEKKEQDEIVRLYSDGTSSRKELLVAIKSLPIDESEKDKLYDKAVAAKEAKEYVVQNPDLLNGLAVKTLDPRLLAQDMVAKGLSRKAVLIALRDAEKSGAIDTKKADETFDQWSTMSQ
jgi:hypothetical protein